MVSSPITYAVDTLTVTTKESCYIGGSYNWQTHTWINYCPMCGCHGSLYLEFDGTYPEGIIVCGRCDADYCGNHGTEHSTPARAYLTRYTTPEPKPQPELEPVKELTAWEKAHMVFKTYEII